MYFPFLKASFHRSLGGLNHCSERMKFILWKNHCGCCWESELEEKRVDSGEPMSRYFSGLGSSILVVFFSHYCCVEKDGSLRDEDKKHPNLPDHLSNNLGVISTSFFPPISIIQLFFCWFCFNIFCIFSHISICFWHFWKTYFKTVHPYSFTFLFSFWMQF